MSRTAPSSCKTGCGHAIRRHQIHCPTWVVLERNIFSITAGLFFYSNFLIAITMLLAGVSAMQTRVVASLMKRKCGAALFKLGNTPRASLYLFFFFLSLTVQCSQLYINLAQPNKKKKNPVPHSSKKV